jgi:hypothetical protein
MNSRSIKRYGTAKMSAFAISLAAASMPITFAINGYAATFAADAPTVTAPLAPMMQGFRWGMSHADVANVYNQVGGLFDKEYDPVLSKLQPGVEQKNVEGERDAKKAGFVNSYVEFRDVPTGYDQREGLKGEFTYRNHEAVMELTQYGKHRYFFFIGDRFWKLYDEAPLGDSSAYGTNFQTAITKMQASLGLPGRVRQVDFDSGLNETTVDWQDSVTHLRLVDRGPKIIGVVLEERATLNNLPQLRANKMEDPLAMDPSILAITKGHISDPNAQHAAPAASATPKKK